jgi:elongation factor P hydroxylase
MAGVLDYAPAMSTNMNVDPTGSTFAGTINGRIKVYVDPYASAADGASDWYVAGYRGSSAYDAGIFYCPYVPLQMVRAVSEATFQPRIAFKTRYGMAVNPFSKVGSTGAIDASSQPFSPDNNCYYRRAKVTNIM